VRRCTGPDQYKYTIRQRCEWWPRLALNRVLGTEYEYYRDRVIALMTNFVTKECVTKIVSQIHRALQPLPAKGAAGRPRSAPLVEQTSNQRA
jgi:hypothetical protein